MRGSAFHNYLVYEAGAVIEDAGFVVEYEAAIHLTDGRLNFLDILGCCAGKAFGCEIETTPRNVVSNVQKALQARMPVIVVVPNRELRRAVRRRLEAELGDLSQQRIWISLLSRLSETVAACFPGFPAGEWWNRETENKSLSPTRAGGG